MVALIHNQMAIIAHEIVNEAASNNALYDCYIKQCRCLCAATTDPANSALWHSEERGKALDSLMLQLPTMYQYDCIHTPLRNQPRAAHGFSERAGGSQHSRSMRMH